jgi:hypothetical protein
MGVRDERAPPWRTNGAKRRKTDWNRLNSSYFVHLLILLKLLWNPLDISHILCYTKRELAWWG